MKNFGIFNVKNFMCNVFFFEPYANEKSQTTNPDTYGDILTKKKKFSTLQSEYQKQLQNFDFQ